MVVLVVRKGNPKHITGWSDLTKKGVDVITPNPISSGGARWNIMAAYGAQIKQGKTPQQALDYLKALFANVSVQDKSARDALNTFTQGKGDVLISYENDAITAQQKGQSVDYVIPKQTILIENPAAVLKNSKHLDAGSGVPRLPAYPGGPADLRVQGLPTGDAVARRQPRSSPLRRCCSRSRTSAAGRPSRPSSSIRRRAGDQDRAGAGGVHCLRLTQPQPRFALRGRSRASASRAAPGRPSGAGRSCCTSA